MAVPKTAALPLGDAPTVSNPRRRALGRDAFRERLDRFSAVIADREKISKSKQGQGGYEKPQTAEAYVRKWGADVVRLWDAVAAVQQDLDDLVVVALRREDRVDPGADPCDQITQVVLIGDVAGDHGLAA